MAAAAAVHKALHSKQQEAEALKLHRAAVLETSARIWREQEARLQTDVRSARAVLTNYIPRWGPPEEPNTARPATVTDIQGRTAATSARSTKGAILVPNYATVREALRETARDCRRREKQAELEFLSKREATEAQHLTQQTSLMQREHEKKLQYMLKQEEEALAHRRLLEHARAAATPSYAADHAAFKDTLIKLRQKHSEKMQGMAAERRKQKADKEQAEKEERARSEAKRQAKAADVAQRKAEEQARQLAHEQWEVCKRNEIVVKEATSVVARCQAELERFEEKVALASTPVDKATDAELRRLQDRLAHATKVANASRAKLEAGLEAVASAQSKKQAF